MIACRMCLLMLFPVVLLAQAAEAETNGVRVGNGRMHPSIDIEARYDNLAGIGFAGGAETVGDMILRVRPGLTLEIPGANHAFSLAAKADYNRYLGISMRGTRSLSYFGGDAHLGLELNPGSRFSLEAGNRFTRSDRTSAVGLGYGVLSLFNEVYVSAPIRPGGGALMLRPAYSFAFEFFSQDVVDSPFIENAGELNYVSHRPGLEVSWRFLPKTAVVLDVRSDLRGYFREGNVPARAFYALLGVSGLVAPRFVVVARGGYGDSFLPEGSEVGDFRSFIGQLDGTYVLSESARLKAGVARTFFPVPRLGWYGDNRFYVTGQALLGGRLILEMDAALHLLRYATARQDQLFQPAVSASYRITPWLNAGLGYRYSLRRSDEARHEYDRQEVFGTIVMTY